MQIREKKYRPQKLKFKQLFLLHIKEYDLIWILFFHKAKCIFKKNENFTRGFFWGKNSKKINDKLDRTYKNDFNWR